MRFAHPLLIGALFLCQACIFTETELSPQDATHEPEDMGALDMPAELTRCKDDFTLQRGDSEEKCGATHYCEVIDDQAACHPNPCLGSGDLIPLTVCDVLRPNIYKPCTVHVTNPEGVHIPGDSMRCPERHACTQMGPSAVCVPLN